MDRDVEQFLAGDAFHRWKRMVRKAKTSVTVFTPFFNKTLLSLLKSSGLDGTSLTVVTNFSADVLLEAPQQLRAMKALLGEGVDVRHLDRLHSKTLLVDGEQVASGSQNFTSNGRKARESTVFSQNVGGSSYVRDLTRWLKESTPIEEGLVDSLLACVDKALLRHKSLLEEFTSEFSLVRNDYFSKQAQEKVRRMRRLEAESAVQFPHGPVHAHLEVKEFYSDAYWGSSLDFSWVLVSDDDLTHWRLKGQSESRLVSFERLYMRPIILADSYRMAFARVGKRRITYLRYGVSWIGKSLSYRGYRCAVSIAFPEENASRRNIVATIRCGVGLKAILEILFTVDSAQLVAKRFENSDESDVIGMEGFRGWIEGEFGESEGLVRFLSRFLSPFRFERLGVANRNAEEFFDSREYWLSLLDWQGAPLFVAYPA